MPSPKHLAVVAAAGSHKTEFVVTEALAHSDKRILITTYTNHNMECIRARILSKVGHIPANITVMSWFSFLAGQWCRPYQRALLGEPGVLRGIDFESVRSRYISQANTKLYYTNKAGDLYKDWVSDFAVKVDQATDGAAVVRVGEIYDEIYVDEVQDLVGYDLDVLDLLLKAHPRVVMVGDPRQHTFATNVGIRNKKYRGSGLHDWLSERTALCDLETRDVSYRCVQPICDFADSLFPELPPTRSANQETNDLMGIIQLTKQDASAYISAHNPVVLRHSISVDTLGFEAINFGASKGNTFDHVVIFTTQPMRKFLEKADPTQLADESRSKFYVAVTRARFSVALVL